MDAHFSRLSAQSGLVECGNVTTKEIVKKVLDNEATIHSFFTHPTAALLEIY